MTRSLFRHLECTACARTHPARLDGLCDCGGLLLARYDAPSDVAVPGGALWSWSALLPPCRPMSLPGDNASELMAPLDGALYKDDGELPTGTFKARGAAVGVAMARKLAARSIVLPTAGNAGAAWAAYSKSAGLPCVVFAASDAPAEAISAARWHGARVEVVEGSIADAAAAAAAYAATVPAAHYAATFREPWRVEGKKTALFEVASALGRLPDAAVLPVGGGVGAVAWHKAAAEARALGWFDGATRIYAVQADGCAPIVRAFAADADVVEPWGDPQTAAPGLRIPAPLGGSLVLAALRESGGGAVAVGEEAMLDAQKHLAGSGIAGCVEAAAAWAGYQDLRAAGAFGKDETVVVYGTGR